MGTATLMVIIGLIMFWVFDLPMWLSVLIGVIAGVLLGALGQSLFTASPAPDQTPQAEEKWPKISNQGTAAEISPEQETDPDKPG